MSIGLADSDAERGDERGGASCVGVLRGTTLLDLDGPLAF
jgi:hypothetical protein